jgi:hypothetical protein
MRTLGDEGRRLTWTTELQMGDGCCRLGAPQTTTMEVWERRWAPVTPDLEPGHIRHLKGEVFALLSRLSLLAADRARPQVQSITGPATETRSVLFDVGLGGLAYGHVHLVVSASPEARTAVLLDLVRNWRNTDDKAVLYAGPGLRRGLVEAMMASGSGVARASIASAALKTTDWMRLMDVDTLPDLRVRVAGGVREAHDLQDDDLGAIIAVAVDLDELTLGQLADWQRLAAREGLVIVLGVEAASPALAGHECPELGIALLASSPSLSRMACRGVRIDGGLSRKIVIDIDRASLALRDYDPANAYGGGEIPVDEELEWMPEDNWVTAAD